MSSRLAEVIREFAQAAHVADKVAASKAQEVSSSDSVIFHGPTALFPKRLRLATKLEIDGQDFEIEAVWAAGPVNEALARNISNKSMYLKFVEEKINARPTDTP